MIALCFYVCFDSVSAIMKIMGAAIFLKDGGFLRMADSRHLHVNDFEMFANSAFKEFVMKMWSTSMYSLILVQTVFALIYLELHVMVAVFRCKKWPFCNMVDFVIKMAAQKILLVT